MFRRGVAVPWTMLVDGLPVRAREGDSIAAAMLAAGLHATRRNAVSGAARGPWCMMGACFECVAVVDGQRDIRTCMTQARNGSRVDTQRD